MPEFREFGPAGGGRGEEPIALRVDEYEAMRLIDYLGLSQEEAAAGMAVSRATIQGIYETARRKLAAALVEGKCLQVEGGVYQICPKERQCRGKRCCRRGEEP